MADTNNNKSSTELALRVLELVAQGRIDRTDAMIMSAMLEWPRPFNAEIARRFNIPKSTAHYRIRKLHGLISL